MPTDPNMITRHPLGLPRGSVRAVLSILILGLFWTILLLPKSMEPEGQPLKVPMFLYFLTGVIVLFLFGGGRPDDEASVWRIVARLFVIGGTLAVIGLQLYRYPEQTMDRLKPGPEQIQQWPALVIAVLAGFGVAGIARLGPWRRWPAFQDVQAWLSLLAMLALGIEVMVLLLINPNLKDHPPINLTGLEVALTALVACYFGTRAGAGARS